jgi:exonuclease III
MDFGYIDDHLEKSCDIIDLLLYEEYKNPEYILNSNLKICTWNIWGLLKYSEEFMKWSIEKRLNRFIEEIKSYDIDIICLQEVSTPVFNYLKKHLSGIYNFYEKEINIENTTKDRNRNLEILFLSKYKAKSYTNYSIGGILGYNNQISILEYKNLVLFGIYLQAGSKHSIGQELKYKYYSRCRTEQLITLIELIKTYKCRNKIILGDFNFDLDGSENDWSEIKIYKELFDKYNFIDSIEYNKDNYVYTEDTTINHMRYNSKFVEKHFRYDGIIISNNRNIEIIDSIVIGKDEIYLNSNETSEMIKHLVYKKDIKRMKKNKYELLSLWISDHFGVLTTLKISF